MGACTKNLLLLVILVCAVVAASGASDSEILLKFKNSLSNETQLSSWDESTHPCSNWKGVICDDGDVWGLQLENMGLIGMIDIDSLVDLHSLRSISFKYNSFDGPMPHINRLGALKSLFLSNNRFSGEIKDDAFNNMNLLKKVYLANNQFTGKFPKSLVELPRLLELSLEGNRFQGRIPEFKQKDLQVMNLSNNQLEGPIPANLSKFGSTSFLGNKALCGKPLELCKSPKKASFLKMALIIIAVLVILSALVGVMCLIQGCRRVTKTEKVHQKVTDNNYDQEKQRKEVLSMNHHAGGGKYKKGEQGEKLYFVNKEREIFELQDLLRASAEVLGSGNFGSSYKATLLSGPVMVVKRYKQMNNTGKEEFHEHMKRLGMFSHPNLLPLVALYYKKDEKLLVSDFVENGSLASHLHSKRAPGQPGLDWPTRLRIVKGVARGLDYLYKELPELALPHGHLKSSNVLLDHAFEPLLADYALVPVIDNERAQELLVAYKSPEFTRTTRKTDVWSLGILILEMLTGKFPANYLKQGKGANTDLATWVNSVVREEWTGEVFDKDMKGTKNRQGEMLKLLKIGMCCCEWNTDRRWDLREAIDKIEELKEKESDDDYSSYASEGEMYSSRAISDDDFSFSVIK